MCNLLCVQACSNTSVMSDSAALWTVGSPVHGILQRRLWSRLPCPPPGDLPHPGIEPMSPGSPALQSDSLPLSHWGSNLLYVSFIPIKLVKK